MVNVTKRTVRAAERSYEWSPTEGVTWGLITNIGAKIASVASAWPGVSAGICLQSVVPTAIFDMITNETFSQREQNEKLVVPPRTKVNAVITTYAVQHEPVTLHGRIWLSGMVGAFYKVRDSTATLFLGCVFNFGLPHCQRYPQRSL